MTQQARRKLFTGKLIGLIAAGCLGQIAIATLILGVVLSQSAKAPVSVRSRPVPVATPDPAAAANALTAFYATVMKLVKPCDQASADAQAGIAEGDKVSAYDAAVAGQDTCSRASGEVLALTIPPEIKGEARGATTRAQLNCKTALDSMTISFVRLAEILDGDARASKMSAFRTATEQSNQQKLACGAEFFEAAQKVGIKPGQLIKAGK